MKFLAGGKIVIRMPWPWLCCYGVWITFHCVIGFQAAQVQKNMQHLYFILVLEMKFPITRIFSTPAITLNDFVPLPGELGFTRSGGNKQEHAGAHVSNVWWCPAPDLHINAKRLIPTLHELPCLQKPTQERLGAMSRVLNLSDPTRVLPSPSFFWVHFSLCGVCLKGPYCGSSQGFYHIRDLYLNKTLRSPGHWILKQCLKSPDGSIPQVLLQINIARSSKGLSVHFHIFKKNLFYLFWIVLITFFVFTLKDDVTPSMGYLQYTC